MTGGYIYEQIKYFAPLVSAGVLAYKGIRWFDSMRATMEAIKSNDLHHIYDELHKIPARIDDLNKSLIEAQDRSSAILIGELQQLRGDIRALKQ
jgi:hypothetical protein